MVTWSAVTKDAVARWKTAMRASGMTPSTVRQREESLERFSRWARVDPLDATTDHCAAWLGRTRADGVPLKASTRSTYFNDLHSFFHWCEDDDAVVTARPSLVRSPMRRLTKPRPNKLVPKPITTRQLKALMAAAGRDKRTRAQIMLAAYQGLRAHEVAKFRAEDLDVESGKLYVLGKGQKEAWLPLHPVIVELADSMPAAGYWFPDRTGTGHEQSATVSTRVAALLREIGVDWGAIHRLRHWYGTQLQRAGKDLRQTQRLMRHASVSSTEIYTEVDEDQARETLGALPMVS